MKVFVVGSGGREDSINWKLRQEGVEVFKSPEYVGYYGYNDLVVIGPEAPIAEGLGDELESRDVPVFGPTKLAGRLETSKLWSKQFMQRHDIPTARWQTYNRSTIEEAIIRPNDKFPIVIKEDGLCGGKGVSICETLEEAINVQHTFIDNKFNSSSNKVLIEDFIKGVEASCFVLTDGKDYKILPYCQDHKPVGEGNTGPNTGGMGAFCPTSRITEKLKKKI